jgi:hypothetical protein
VNSIIKAIAAKRHNQILFSFFTLLIFNRYKGTLCGSNNLPGLSKIKGVFGRNVVAQAVLKQGITVKELNCRQMRALTAVASAMAELLTHIVRVKGSLFYYRFLCIPEYLPVDSLTHYK